MKKTSRNTKFKNRTWWAEGTQWRYGGGSAGVESRIGLRSGTGSMTPSETG